MIPGNNKTILKKILENHQKIDHKNLSITEISEQTQLSQEKVYASIQKLLTYQYVKITDNLPHWTAKPFTITEKGIKVLEFDYRRLIRDIFVGVAVFVSIIALVYPN